MRALGALALTLAGAIAAPAHAGPKDWAAGKDRDAAQAPDISKHSVLTIPHNATFPLTKKVAMGNGKSFLVQFPFELKDVLVADPNKVDAVVQSADRVFLIAKKAGQTNAFFFDTNGQQVLTIEVTVGADLSSLDALLKRLIPGSNVKVEMAGKALVLVGSVRTPLDSNRAADIAEQFAEANTELISAVNGGGAAGQPGGQAANGGSSFNASFQMQPNGKNGGGGASDKKVINLLNVEGEEQVMLKVTVAEVQRSLLKQFGINLGATINAGNFTTGLLTANALPLTAAL
ncbi:MAG: pilus assembly protein N-terminal domain-containing protein, partial [Hyphomicrobium sp.]